MEPIPRVLLLRRSQIFIWRALWWESQRLELKGVQFSSFFKNIILKLTEPIFQNPIILPIKFMHFVFGLIKKKKYPKIYDQVSLRTWMKMQCRRSSAITLDYQAKFSELLICVFVRSEMQEPDADPQSDARRSLNKPWTGKSSQLSWSNRGRNQLTTLPYTRKASHWSIPKQFDSLIHLFQTKIQSTLKNSGRSAS